MTPGRRTPRGRSRPTGTEPGSQPTSVHVRAIPPASRSATARFLTAATATVLVTALAGACADATSGPESADLTPAASQGRSLFQNRGCQGCHGSDGSGGIGPPLAGIAGTPRGLDDGTTITADTDYLRRAITDPGAEIVTGYTVRMPSNDIDGEGVDALIAYIESLEATP